MGRLATPDDALFAALVEIEGLRDSVAYPDGRRAQFVSFHDQNRIDAFNEAWDRIEALRTKLAERSDPLITALSHIADQEIRGASLAVSS